MDDILTASTMKEPPNLTEESLRNSLEIIKKYNVISELELRMYFRAHKSGFEEAIQICAKYICPLLRRKHG